MERFLQLYQPHIIGVLEGFDRLLFRGTQMSICFLGGLEKFLVHHGVKLKDFGRFADRLTQKIKRHAKNLAKRLGRRHVHVPSPKGHQSPHPKSGRLADRLTERLPADLAEHRRWSVKSARWLRLLCAHGLIRKVPNTRYYRVTHKGVQVTTTALKLCEIDLRKVAA